MTSLTHPVGPQKAGVYWRRRVALLVVLVVLGTLAAVALGRGGGDDAAASAPAAEQGPGPAEPVGDQSAAEPGPTTEPEPCAPEALQVVATADAGSYAAGTTPQLGVSVRNTAADACTVDLGAAAIELLVVSGADRIWSSRDCPQDAAASVVTVDARGEQAVATAWPRQRSEQGCPADLAEPRAGTYQLTASLAGTSSAPVSFSLE